MRNNNIGKYSWINNKFASVIQNPPKIRQHIELCSIPNDKDNYSLLENTVSPTSIISKGFFQTAAQKALQNSEIEKAFEVVEQYIETTKRKFYRFLDTETKKIIISKQLNRFDAAYVLRRNRNYEAYEI